MSQSVHDDAPKEPKGVSLGPPGGVLYALKSMWRRCWRGMMTNNAMVVSASLSYRTVFALVPALVLGFFILKASGAVEDSKKSLHQVLEAAGMAHIAVKAEDSSQSRPATTPTDEAPESVNLAEKIESAIASVEGKMTFARLGPIGLVLMAWSAIALLTTIERALNRIFHAAKSRRLMVRVLLYWSAITFLPVVLVAAGFVGAKATEMISRQAPLAGLVLGLDLLSNLVMGVIVLACVYKFLPNTNIPFRSALVGASVVVPLWIVARWGFSLYVSQFVAKGSVYGTLGLLPLFLLWINLCWYGFLFGAEAAFAWASRRRPESAEQSLHTPIGSLDVLSAALAVGGSYVMRQRPAGFREIVNRLGLPAPAVRRLLEKLTAGGIICPVVRDGQDDAYVPARPLESIDARDVLRLSQTRPDGRQIAPELDRPLEHVRSLTQGALGNINLRQLLQQKPADDSIAKQEPSLPGAQ